MKDFTNKFEIFQNANRTITQNFIEEATEFQPYKQDPVKIEKIEFTKYYRLICDVRRVKSLNVKIKKNGKTDGIKIDTKNSLANIWRLCHFGDGKVKMFPEMLPEQALVCNNDYQVSFQPKSENDESQLWLFKKDLKYGAIQIQRLNGLACMTDMGRVRPNEKIDVHQQKLFYIEEVSEKQLRVLREQMDFFNNFKGSRIQLEQQGTLRSYNIEMKLFGDLMLPKEVTQDENDDSQKKKEDIDLVDHIVKQFFPIDFKKKIEGLPSCSDSSLSSTFSKVNTFKMIQSKKTEKMFAIQNIFDDTTGSFQIVVYGVVAKPDSSIYFDLERKYGPVTVLQDKRLTSTAIQSQHNSKFFHPEYINYKICDDGIEFVVVRHGKIALQIPDLVDNTIQQPSDEKTMALVKYDVDTGRSIIIDYVQFNISELSLDKEDKMDSTEVILMPVRYMKHLNFTDENYEDQYMTQICKITKQDDSTPFLCERQAKSFRFKDHTMMPISLMNLPDCQTSLAPHEIIIDKKYAQNLLAAQGEYFEWLSACPANNFIFVLNNKYLLSVLHDHLAPVEPKHDFKNLKVVRQESQIVKEENEESKELAKIKEKLGLDRVNQDNTYVEINDHGDLTDKHFQENFHNFILNHMKNIEISRSADHKNITSAFLDDYHTGVMSILITNRGYQPESNDGLPEVVIFKFDKMQTNYYHGVQKQDFVASHAFTAKQDDTEISQHCFGVMRKYSEIDFTLNGKEAKSLYTKVGRIIDVQLQNLSEQELNDRVAKMKRDKDELKVLEKFGIQSDDKIRELVKLRSAVTKWRPKLNKWAICKQKGKAWIIKDKAEQDCQVRMSATNDQFEFIKFNRLQFQEVIYLEDDRDCLPVIMYNMRDLDISKKNEIRTTMEHHFMLIDEWGNSVKNTVINLFMGEVEGDNQSICYSSEVIYPKKKIKYEKDDYFVQHYQVQVADGNYLMHIFEIEVKYFENGTKYAMLVGKKLIISQDFKNLKPLFLKNKTKDQIKIMGTQLEKMAIMTNPDLSLQLDNQFDFVNNFTCTRVKRFERALVVESYLKEYWVKVGHLSEFDIIKTYNRQLRLELLNNSIYLAMNSQVLNISDFMNSELVQKDTDEKFQESLIEQQRYFMTSSILQGRSIAEFCFNNELIMRAIDNFKDLEYGSMFQKIKKTTSDDIFLLSPLENLVREWALDGNFCHKIDKVQKIIADRYLMHKCIVYFNFDLTSNMQLMLERIKRQQCYDYCPIFTAMFNSLQDSSMTSGYKREQIMSCLNYVLSDFQEGQRSNFKCLVEFMDNYQHEVIIQRNFKFVQEIDTKNMDKATGPASLRISNEQEKEKNFRHKSAPQFIIKKYKELQDETSSDYSKAINNDACCWRTNYDVRAYYVDFVDFNQAAAITKVFQCEDDIEAYRDIDDRMEYLANIQNLIALTSNMLDMAGRSQLEVDDYLVIQDIIDFQYINYTYPYYLSRLIGFTIFYVIPLSCILLQVFTTPEYIMACLILCMVTQIYVLIYEVVGTYGSFYRKTNIDSIGDDIQNVFDYISIIYTQIYCITRLYFIKVNPELLPDNAEANLKNWSPRLKFFHDLLPIAGIIWAFLSFFQWSFLFAVLDQLNFMKKLIIKAVLDTFAFLAFSMVFMLLFLMCFTQLATQFDDRGNFDLYDRTSNPDGYDTHFNDYPVLSYGMSSFVAQLRNMLGDPQPPAYDYWANRLLATKPNDYPVPHIYIFFTWFIWFMQFFIVIILLLNLLISIVGESYSWCMTNEAVSKMRGRMELNDQYVNEIYWSTFNVQPIYSILFCTKCSVQSSQDDESVGIVQRINKSIIKLRDNVNNKIGELKLAIDENQDKIKLVDSNVKSIRTMVKGLVQDMREMKDKKY